MAAVAPGLEVLAGLRAGSAAKALPGIRQMVELTVDREPSTESGKVPEATAAHVPRLRRIARAKLSLWGLSPQVDTSLLLVSELVTNGLRYGSGQLVALRLALTSDLLIVEVDDGSSARPSLRCAGSDAESGRGLFLVDTLADAWGVSPDGTTTWAVLNVPKQRS